MQDYRTVQLMLTYPKGSSAKNLGTRPILQFVAKRLQPELTRSVLRLQKINMNYSFYFSSHSSFSLMCITMSQWQYWQIYHIYRPQTKFVSSVCQGFYPWGGGACVAGAVWQGGVRCMGVCVAGGACVADTTRYGQ